MPLIATIEGVKILIYAIDHPPPHIHAIYSGDEAQISIETGELLKGNLPLPKLRLVRYWLDANRDWVSYMWDEIDHKRNPAGRTDK